MCLGYMYGTVIRQIYEEKILQLLVTPYTSVLGDLLVSLLLAIK